MTLKTVSVNLKIPGFGGVTGAWSPDKQQQDAAWEMYVELITRISTVELREDEGLLREALTSLYSVFGSTREILKKYGPKVARPTSGSNISFGHLSVAVLNLILRPMLAKWHPLLLDFESQKGESRSAFEHERSWDKNDELRAEIETTRQLLVEYASLLEQAAGVPSLINAEPLAPKSE